MRAISIAAAACLALAGCQTTKIDEAIQESLPRICQNAETAHTAFVIVASTGKISQSTKSREEAAYTTLQGLCRNPSNQTAASVLIAAVQAYANMTSALKEAQRVQ